MSKIAFSFVARSLSWIKKAQEEGATLKIKNYTGYNYGQIIAIGDAFFKVYKEQNYVGEEVDEFYCTEEWSDFLKLHVRPMMWKFEKPLASVDHRTLLDRKATLGDDDFDAGCYSLDQMLLADDVAEPDGPPSPQNSGPTEHMVIIDPLYLDSRVFLLPIQHDIEDLLREING